MPAHQGGGGGGNSPGLDPGTPAGPSPTTRCKSGGETPKSSPGGLQPLAQGLAARDVALAFLVNPEAPWAGLVLHPGSVI